MIYQCSNTGQYHKQNDSCNQDYICTEVNGKISVISLADGVSSCRKARAGAETAGRAITHLLSRRGDVMMEYDSREIARIANSHVVYELEKAAEADNNPVTDYSSTVSSVMYDRSSGKMLIYNLGDCIILTVSDGTCRIAAMPCDSRCGCCVTTTVNAESEAVAEVINTERIDSVVICSDGAWREMFRGCRLKDEVEAMLVRGRYDELSRFLTKCGCHDDNSFVAMKVSSGRMA